MVASIDGLGLGGAMTVCGIGAAAEFEMAALVAPLIPARRATRVDPIVARRAE